MVPVETSPSRVQLGLGLRPLAREGIGSSSRPRITATQSASRVEARKPSEGAEAGVYWSSFLAYSGPLVLGCGGRSTTVPADSPPTFTRDVAPILFEHCAPCHRPGEEAVPFPLLSYADASSRGEKIARAVRSRRMPPWLPEAGGVAFVGERRLSPEQIDTIDRWVRTGAVEGRAEDRPTPPSFLLDRLNRAGYLKKNGLPNLLH